MRRIQICYILFVSIMKLGYSQDIKYIPDTILINATDSIGLLQWQVSSDSINWHDVIGENKSHLIKNITDNCYFRLQVTNDNCKYHSDIICAEFNPDKRIYGVRIDRNQPTINSIERIYDSKNKVAYVEVEGQTNIMKDDFSKIYPFNSIKLCNIISLSGNYEVIYENQESFSRKNDTFVEIPLFYMNRFIKDGYDYRLISKTQYDGFYPAPMFIENGKVLDKVYIAAYETSVDGKGLPVSVTGKIPSSSKTISEFRNLYKNKGNGFSSIDIRTIMSIEHMYLIYYANKNSQECVGGGWTDLSQPAFKILNVTKSLTNAIIVQVSSLNAEYHWFIGQSVCVVKGSKAVDYAKIIDIKKDNPISGQTTFFLDRSLNIDESMTFGSSAQLTGYCDGLSIRTGRTKQKTLKMNNQACAVNLFGLENLWGNVWEYVDGLVLKGLTPFIGFDMKFYNDNGDGYIPMTFQCIEQPENNPYDGNFGYIENLGIDKTYGWLCFPESIGNNGVNATSGYGDFFYQPNDIAGNRYAVFGGGFDHFSRAGIFNLRNWNTLSMSWYLYGSRMQFKFVN